MLINGKGEQSSHPLDTLIKLGARYMLQVALEEEVLEFLGRSHYTRGSRLRTGYRSGYETRNFKSANGILQEAIPQLRDPEEEFSSRLLKRLKKGSEVLERLVCEMYVRGLSTGDGGVMVRVSANWIGVRILNPEREQLDRIRQQIFRNTPTTQITGSVTIDRQQDVVSVC